MTRIRKIQTAHVVHCIRWCQVNRHASCLSDSLLTCTPSHLIASIGHYGWSYATLMVSSTMSHLSRIRPGLARAAVAWPQLTCVRDRSYTTTAVAMARVWRPDMNDVDRLSKGDGAKKRGGILWSQLRQQRSGCNNTDPYFSGFASLLPQARATITYRTG